MSNFIALLVFFAALPSPLVASTQGPTWCGKVYMSNETVQPPGGQFVPPDASTTPLLALRCNPTLIPFLPDDDGTAGILVDALVRYSHIAGAQALSLPNPSSSATLSVTASLDGKQVASGTVSLNGTSTLSFSLDDITPRTEPYALSCTGQLAGQTFTSNANLTYLPSPPSGIGSVTKRDLRTGGILAKAVNSSGSYEPIFPIGFYTNWDGYLNNGGDTIVENLQEEGFNMVHPTPPFDNTDAFDATVDKMEQLGLWLMYDMRWNYQDLDAVGAETAPLRPRKNLLLYYTADEPDGTSDPLNATSNTYNYLQSLDPYRPTSLVLNCQDYYFTEYASGADILLQDVYQIGNNVTFSNKWQTPCTTIQGCCGCDNCKGRYEDIRDRIGDFKYRMEALGWERTKTVWTVPQAFGGEDYWVRTPNGSEWLIQAIVGMNAGARGIVSWNDPTTASIKEASSSFAEAMSAMVADYILHPNASYTHVITDDRIDLGVWVRADTGKALVLGANLNYASASVSFGDVLTNAKVTGSPNMVFDGGAKTNKSAIAFDAVQSGAWVFPVTASNSGSTANKPASSGAAKAIPWLAQLTHLVPWWRTAVNHPEL